LESIGTRIVFISFYFVLKIIKKIFSLSAFANIIPIRPKIILNPIHRSEFLKIFTLQPIIKYSIFGFQYEPGVIRESISVYVFLMDDIPIKDLSLIADPDKNFLVIVKDGVIYKNLTK